MQMSIYWQVIKKQIQECWKCRNAKNANIFYCLFLHSSAKAAITVLSSLRQGHESDLHVRCRDNFCSTEYELKTCSEASGPPARWQVMPSAPHFQGVGVGRNREPSHLHGSEAGHTSDSDLRNLRIKSQDGWWWFHSLIHTVECSSDNKDCSSISWYPQRCNLTVDLGKV